MAATPEYYSSVLEQSPIESESVTYVIVSNATRELVAEAMGIDLSDPRHQDDVFDDTDHTAYALVAAAGGVVAIEPTGYGDPTRDTLKRLSEGGRAAAVIRSNIQAHVRFGCARNGELVFDDDEYMYVEDPSAVPDELRSLFDLAWVDLGAEDDEESDVDPEAVAMAELVTGLEVSAEHLADAADTGFFRAPSLVYAMDE